MISLFLAMTAAAGTNADVAAGLTAYEQRDYSRAIAELQAALSEPVRLKARNVPKAHIALARSLVAALSEAAQRGDMLALAALEDAPLQAAESLLIARDHPKASWGEAEEIQLQLVQSLLLQAVMGALSISEPGVVQEFVPWADMAARIGGYIPLDLRGQLKARLGDNDGAYADYQAALATFRDAPPDSPELLIGYTAYRAAMHARYTLDDPEAALGHIDEGLALLEREWARLGQPDAAQQRQHVDAQADLHNFRLDILQSVPALYEVALVEFAAAVEVEPGSYIKRLAYAQLLEQSDLPAAIKQYEEAVRIDPDQPHAHFNLGALFVNDAAARLQEANSETDPLMVDSLMAEVRAKFLLARPYLERAMELQPDNREALRALKQIALQLDDIEAYRRLEALEAALP